jgi:hypothetical protein
MKELLKVIASLALLVLAAMIFGVGGCTLLTFMVPLPPLGFLLGLAWLGLMIYIADKIGGRIRFKEDEKSQ